MSKRSGEAVSGGAQCIYGQNALARCKQSKYADLQIHGAKGQLNAERTREF